MLGGLLAGVYFSRYKGEIVQAGFYTLLRDYDFKHRRVLREGAGGGSPLPSQYQEVDSLNRELDRLEKKAEGVENWLSILKRRRQIAALDSRYNQAYRESSGRALLAFPHSEQISIIAAAALIHDSAITKEGEEELRKILPLITGSHFTPARLSFHILLNDFKNPGRAASNLGSEFMESELPSLSAAAAGKIVPNLIILKILAGDTSGAEAMINTVFAQGGRQTSNEFIRLAAEFFYDFGDMLRSAELFSMLPDEDALIRQADALWLAGYAQNARNLWVIAASRPSALYNLAVTSQTQEEARSQYELLLDRTDTDELYHQYGVIRYSRLMDAPKALVFLDAGRPMEKEAESFNTALPRSDTALSADALYDLEKTRRRIENAEAARIIADTWLLLNYYPNIEELYQWGAWRFVFQRNYSENALLLKAASRHNFNGNWKGIYEALQLIYEGDTDAAEKILSEIPSNGENWIAAANLARIYEARQSPARALTHYEKAFTIITSNTLAPGWKEAASRIQVRIAYCHRLLGRVNESRRALEYALELNPDNLNARLELGRL